jgi:proline iminopeptidase
MRVTVHGAPIFFEVVGRKLAEDGPRLVEKPTLVVLHGGPGWDHSTGIADFSGFSDLCQVVLYDHRAHGRSGGWDERATHTLAQWGDDVRGFCDALDIRRPIVLGTSFGGMVAQSYAIRHPEHPAGVVLNTTAPRFDLEETCATFARVVGPEAADIARATFTDPTPDNLALYQERCLSQYSSEPLPDEVKARIIYNDELLLRLLKPGGELRVMDLRPELSRIACPTLILAGSDDPITTAKGSREMAAAIGADAELHVVDGARHNIVRDAPDVGPGLVRAFIDKVATKSRRDAAASPAA